jgi:hypothetical protein
MIRIAHAAIRIAAFHPGPHRLRQDLTVPSGEADRWGPYGPEGPQRRSRSMQSERGRTCIGKRIKPTNKLTSRRCRCCWGIGFAAEA